MRVINCRTHGINAPLCWRGLMKNINSSQPIVEILRPNKLMMEHLPKNNIFWLSLFLSSQGFCYWRFALGNQYSRRFFLLMRRSLGDPPVILDDKYNFLWIYTVIHFCFSKYSSTLLVHFNETSYAYYIAIQFKTFT